MGSLPKFYEFAKAEQTWYAHWHNKDYFKADNTSTKPPYSIVIPPPNVTGYLHIGHALCMTLQDVLIRYKRMDGFDALWLPGTDHASIATQIVVEKQLAAQGIKRHDLGREKFLEKVWEWKEHSGSMIVSQLKRLGCSCDWSRERFTMDEQCNRAVMEAFVKLHREGYIYRGKRLVNWCPVQQTSLSDLEVIHEDAEGAMHHIAYPVAGSDEKIVVATTRPETMLGDTAIIVHPEDPRYAHLIGKQAVLPLCDRTIPILADPYVEREFGTGAMKVTPAHDFNDFEIGERHKLPLINIFTPDAKINENGPVKYQGMDRFDARKAILEDLEAAALLVKIEKHPHSVGKAERSGAIAEPFLSDQWFVNVEKMGQHARDAVINKEVKLIPEVWEKTYFHWMDNLKDWCISRQLWWGHRIPAWHCGECGHITVVHSAPHGCEKCQSANIAQDDDVLDTWFSSQLWPFATLGWPEATEDLKRYYPTSVLITGFDILFFWVARMIMAGYTYMDAKPFEEVYLHALVRDKYGRKMSKTLGNVIDPLSIIDQYGADALRFTLISQAGHGRDIKLDTKRIEGDTTFINKIWNALKFARHTAVEGIKAEVPTTLEIADAWILNRLNGVIKDVRHNLDHYHFNDAAAALYRFIWQDLCDWYIELVKHRLYKGEPESQRTAATVLNFCLLQAMKLLHPFMPFVTEEVYQQLDGHGESIMVDAYPREVNLDQYRDDIAVMEAVMSAIEAVRRVRGEMNISPAKATAGYLRTNNAGLAAAAGDYFTYFQSLARLESLEVVDASFVAPQGSATAVFGAGEIILPLTGIIDFAEEFQRIEKEYKKIEKDFLVYDRKLSNEGFLQKAREEVILADREKRDELGSILEKLRTNLEKVKEYL
ncbi:valine--tRNA ligase [Chrysiogenes arsenatis]|uniref:valine--tRNA ligase n=1 Tax=Chrysiogenes arsenatis TaxID=309797 RepID=UPI00041C823D|nr:valine--tRNA ligase [Chrysiogenes arsenatis]